MTFKRKYRIQRVRFTNRNHHVILSIGRKEVHIGAYTTERVANRVKRYLENIEKKIKDTI